MSRWSLPAVSAARLRRIATLGAGGLLLLLLGCALWTRGLAASAEKTYPPLGRYVEVSGLRQHVLERGQGAPAVFVHGAYGALQDYVATILDDASRKYRCVLWDRPGHGYSERPAGPVDPGVQAELLLQLVRTLGLERPLLVGFSYGGAICLAAALAAPDEIRGVVLINGPSHPWPDPLDLEYRVGELPVLGWLLSETVTAPLGSLFASQKVEKAFHPLPVPERFERSPLPLALRPACYRANTEDIFLLKPFLREQSGHYGRLRVPVRALVATEDTVVSPTIHVPQLARAAPDCSPIRVEGAGHQLLYTHASLVLETIDAAFGDGAGSPSAR